MVEEVAALLRARLPFSRVHSATPTLGTPSWVVAVVVVPMLVCLDRAERLHNLTGLLSKAKWLVEYAGRELDQRIVGCKRAKDAARLDPDVRIKATKHNRHVVAVVE